MGLRLCLPVRAQENRYVGFGNTVPPPRREDDFLSSAVSSLCSVRTVSCPGDRPLQEACFLYSEVHSPGAFRSPRAESFLHCDYEILVSSERGRGSSEHDFLCGTCPVPLCPGRAPGTAGS